MSMIINPIKTSNKTTLITGLDTKTGIRYEFTIQKSIELANIALYATINDKMVFSDATVHIYGVVDADFTKIEEIIKTDIIKKILNEDRIIDMVEIFQNYFEDVERKS